MNEFEKLIADVLAKFKADTGHDLTHEEALELWAVINDAASDWHEKIIAEHSNKGE